MSTDRLGMGANNPPPFEAHSIHIEDLFALVSGSTANGAIQNDEQETALDSLMDQLRVARKTADAERAAEKKPHDDAAKEVQVRWKPLIDRCDAGLAEVKRVLTPYREAKQRAKDEVARKAREEAEVKQRAAQEALRNADDLEARFEAEAELKTATKLSATANRIDRQATGLRSREVATVTDHRKLLQHIMRTDEAPLKAWLEAYAQRALPTRLPGVEVSIERKAA